MEQRVIGKILDDISTGVVTDEIQGQLQAANSVSGVMALAHS